VGIVDRLIAQQNMLDLKSGNNTDNKIKRFGDVLLIKLSRKLIHIYRKYHVQDRKPLQEKVH